MTSKQRAYLRSLASTQKAIFQIGKNEISENMCIQIANALEAHELVKISVLETCGTSAKEASEILANGTESEVVTLIGRKIVLYKESEKHKKIFLEDIR